MSKILLICPTMYSDYAQVEVYFHVKPLGLGYLASGLLEDGHDVKILDVLGRFSLISKTIQEFKPDIVGVTAISNGFIEFKKTILEIRKTFKGLLLAGGPHITATGENDLPIDYFVQGEGELVIKKIANGWRPIEKLIKAEPIKDLDSLPFPARHLFEQELYENNKKPDIFSSRGCPYSCIFCFNAINPAGVRYRTPENVVEELKSMKGKSFNFNDDTFVLNHERTAKFADMLEGKGYDFAVNGRCNLMTDQLCQDLKRMGTTAVYLGVETYNDRLLKLINKSQTKADIIRSLELLHKYKFKIAAYMLMNLPTQTIEEINQDVEFAKSIIKKYKAIVDFSILYVYDSTPLYEMLGQNITDWSTKRHKERFSNVPLWEEKDKSKEEMIELYKKIRKDINYAQISTRNKPYAITNYVWQKIRKKVQLMVNPEKKFN